MRKYDLFLNDGSVSEYSGDWRHVGEFKASDASKARQVAKGYLSELRAGGAKSKLTAQVYTCSYRSVGRQVCEVTA